MNNLTIQHICQVVGANVAAVTIALTNINQMLTTLSLVLASAYTIYKFIIEFKNRKNPKD